MFSIHLPRRATAYFAPFLTILALLWLAALAPVHAAPAISYSKDGVSFEHPEGWKVTEDVVAQDETRLRSIDIEGPDEAVVTLMFSPLLAGQDIEKFAATAARNREDAARANTAQKVKMGPATTAPIARPVGGKDTKGVSQRFVVSLLGQDLPHEARFFKATLGGTTVIIMTQVADENARAAEPGFAMALGTLRYSGSKR
ncbi:hypothetical protein ASF11_18870 [Acidovorax sp. Leaf76]|uniref:hypothetical protein n=1 Tax=unclassified Acidovorax TaxID=2684926 RepID=UPI000700BE05|nr:MULTISPECIES: hypothetical protein [unclassified Acidovorax]KQO25621.1 hypothetical protein ASF11_18870 [Acidovorax sp. Leaf76]KQO29304.1 hypothetical protein ASF19_16535 [Acidovorax sp. Leaf84]KQS25827.1 hypothetical protein ASG27_18915 [Acidovorax sp. Leaf191]